jgi:3-hydroxyisobutyrate dehydrogenase-like beta-hydroxyacid dehydrogenase
LLFTAHLGTAATALSLAQSLGVAPDRLIEVVSRGSGNSFALNAIGGAGGLDRLAGLGGTLLQKDVRLVVDLAEQAGAPASAVLDAADAALTLMDHPR